MANNERVPNRPLSGAECKQIIKDDFDRLLANEGLLSDHIAYGRLAYDITLRLHMDNPMNPESQSSTHSRPAAPPLSQPSPEAMVGGDRISRMIDSPNSERLRMGLPVPVEVRQQDDTTSTQEIKYPPDPSLGDGNVKLEDSAREAADSWGLPTKTSVNTAPNEPVAPPRDGKCGHSSANVALSGLCTVCGAEWIDAATPESAPADPQQWPTNPPDKKAAFFGGTTT